MNQEAIGVLHNINDLRVELNAHGCYDIAVNGEVVCEMVEKRDLAAAVEAILKDKYGMVADMLEE